MNLFGKRKRVVVYGCEQPTEAFIILLADCTADYGSNQYVFPALYDEEYHRAGEL